MFFVEMSRCEVESLAADATGRSLYEPTRRLDYLEKKIN